MFWKKRKSSKQMIEELKGEIIHLEEEHMSIVSSLEKINESIYTISNQLSQSTEKIDKGSRLQYRSTNDIMGKLKKIDNGIKGIQDFQARNGFELKQKEGLIKDKNLLIQVLLKMIDDIDVACDKEIDEHNDNWYKLHKIWQKQIMGVLESIGIREIKVLGNSFDHLLAEAIETMALEEIEDSNRTFQIKEEYVPFEVIKVIRRGFMLYDGSLVRKAQVITLKEERV